MVLPLACDLALGADDFDTQCERTAIQFFDTHKHPQRLRFAQNTFGHTGRQRFQKVQTFGAQFGVDSLGDTIIRQDTIHIVVDFTCLRCDLDHNIETNPL